MHILKFLAQAVFPGGQSLAKLNSTYLFVLQN